MDSMGTSRSSNNFIQHKTDDASLDYSADWDTFSFEAELETRKVILEEDLNAYNNLLEPSPNDSTGIDDIAILKSSEEEINELLNVNNDTISKYISLLEEQKKIKDNLEKLSAKNDALLKTIVDLEQEKTSSEESYKELKTALQKANEIYTTRFNINISTKPLSDTTYEAVLYFKENKDIPIKFIVDRLNRKVLDFQPNGALSSEQEKDIREKFGDFENIHGVFCALHEIISKK